jgi:Helix-turn-helix domain
MSIRAYLHVDHHSKAKQSHLAILYKLASHANTQGIAWPSIATLAEVTGYTARWVKTVLEDLVRDQEITRIKVGRTYRYELHVYDAKRKTCSCEVTSPIPLDDIDIGEVTSEQVQLVPGQVKLDPRQVKWSDANPHSHNENPAEPVFEPDLKPEMNQAPGSLSLQGEEAKTRKTCTYSGGCHDPVGDLHGAYCNPHAEMVAERYKGVDPKARVILAEIERRKATAVE